MVWNSHLLKNFPQFIVIYIVRGFCIVNKAEIDVFLELSCFFDDPADVSNLISGFSAFSKTIPFVEYSLLWCFLAVCGFVQVACQGFLVRKLVLMFWWMELYFFSLECNEMSSNQL